MFTEAARAQDMRPQLVALVLLATAASAKLADCTMSVNPVVFGYVESDNAPQARVPAGSYAFLNIEGCNGCTGGFAVTEANELTIKVVSVDEANFAKYLGGQAYTPIAALSSASTTCAGTDSLASITAPVYVIMECPSSAGVDGCAFFWGLRYTKSEIDALRTFCCPVLQHETVTKCQRTRRETMKGSANVVFAMPGGGSPAVIARNSLQPHLFDVVDGNSCCSNLM